jgi:N-acetylglucosamine-6-phosphate deacetylase
MTSHILRNARVVLPDRVATDQTVTVEHGRIVEIKQTVQSSTSQELDLTGLTLFPGFIDVHIHGAAGIDVMDAGVADLQRLSRFLLSKGVTAWLPTFVPAAQEKYQQSIENIDRAINEQATNEAARILGVHYEGPFVSELQCGALHREDFRTFADPGSLDSLPKLSAPGAIHMTTLAPEIDGGIELIRELTKRGWTVSIGHTRADLETLDRAYEAGARHMTHFMNAMPGLHHRNPGPVGWGLSRDDVSCDLIADGIHLDPLMLRLLLRVKTPERLALISDAIAAAGMGDGDYQIWGETISVENGRTRNKQGSIAGSVITMLEAVQMMRSLGVSEVNVARLASTNPARLLGVDDDSGSIEEGKRADLVGLDEGGKAQFVMASQNHLR